MAEFNIALIPGDGIGPEIVSGAVTVLDAVSKKYGHKFNYQEVYMGGCAIDKYGVPLPQETVDICKIRQCAFRCSRRSEVGFTTV